MPVHSHRVSFATVMACAFALSASIGQATELPIPGKGLFKLDLPPSWKELGRTTSKDLPPTLHLVRSIKARGELEVTVFWDPKGPSKVIPEELIRRLAQKAQAPILESAVEKELPLIPIKGSGGTGFYFSATDRQYTVPATGPVAGEFPIITHGELGLGAFILSFTIYSDQKNDASVQEALAALQHGTIVPVPQKN